MASDILFQSIYASAGLTQGPTRGEGGIYSGFSTSMAVQPDTWIPLNPGLARRYYDMFSRSWIVRTCFQEKIKAGFSGGFGYRYGPESSKSSRKGKEKARGRSGATPFNSFGENAPDPDIITEGPDLVWIEEVLMKGVMYHDILGIVAFRRKVHPRTKSVRVEVVDLPKGYFVGKLDDRGNQEYGWVFHKAPGNAIGGVGRRPIPANTHSTSTDHEPDPEVFVYAWPTLEPDIGAAAPFKSILSTVFLNLLETSEMWQNEIEGHYKMTHPTWVTEADVKTRGPADTMEHDLMLSAIGQLGPTESMQYFEMSRLNAEMAIHISGNLRKMNDKNLGSGQRKLGLKLDNTEAVHTRFHAWQDNHYITPIGTKVGKGPEARLRSDMVNIMNLKASQISSVFGVPIPFLSGGKGSGAKTSIGSRLEGSTYRNTLVQMRRKVSTFFEEAYMITIGSLENSMLANMLTELNHQGGDTENIVRMYVKDILTPGGFMVLDEALTGYRAPDGDSDPIAPKNKKKAKTIDQYEEDELIEPGERKTGADLEAEEIREKMIKRKLFTTPDAVIQSQRIDRAGDVLIGQGPPPVGGPKPHATNATRKKIKGKHDRNIKRHEYEASKRIDKRKRDDNDLDPIQMHLEQWKGPGLRGQDTVLFDQNEREKQDFTDEQAYLGKLEEARWQKFMEKSNLMDKRVSRIMMMALQNFGVALSPAKIQMSLKREMQYNPKLDNAHHRKLAQDPNERMENVLVDEIISGRKQYLNALVDEPNRITIVWNSAPLPDIELLIQASKEGLGIPSELVGTIVAGELGLQDMRRQMVRQQEIDDKKIENYLKRNNLKITSKVTGVDKDSKSAKSPSAPKKKAKDPKKKAKSSSTESKTPRAKDKGKGKDNG